MKRSAPLVIALLSCGPPPAPTFKRVQAEVFDVSCTFAACHVGAGAEGLNLEAPAYQRIVGVKSHGFDGGVLVVPGQPDDSYLYQKLIQEMPKVGVRMPNVGDPLEPARLELVRSWIAEGAKND